MQPTGISWVDYSWNPITGCSHAGPECWNCYAERLHLQQAEREHPPDYVTGEEWTVENASENVTVHPERVEAPLDYGFPKGAGRVFVGSMTDMFHSEVEPDFVQRVLDVCADVPECQWIFLTKRPQNAAGWRLDWPDNAWCGTSVGSGPGGQFPCTTHRIEQLRGVDAETLWVSFEPLIETIGDVALDHVDWVVVGGESGSDDVRREMEHEWARDLLRQAREQGAAFYFKQSSGRQPEQGTALTVEDERFGTFVQKKIREFPHPHPQDRDGVEAPV